MNVKLWLIPALSMLVVAGPQPALLAHQLKSDKTVGALMHLEPNDSPQAGVPTTAWFNLVKRGGEKISLTQCACTLSIYQGPRPLLNPALTPGKEGDVQGIPTALVTFPEQGSYRLVLSGRPKIKSTSFEPFTLSWNVRVSH
ncbi:hypothetical protein [Anthocerotibacter panamensis]|uniref:hypothetical protein n=1 Tax=Anthocerotibacter panamensis TaxID=2857077 RepID=UPI001C408B7B|nr:hypothetical protein [Anthocerotibacter panamensis]